MGIAADLLGLPKTTANVLRGLLTSAIAEGIKVTAWGKGNPTRAVYRSMADFGKFIIDAIGDIADQGTLESGSGDPLALRAEEVYGIKKPGASFATTTLLIDNVGDGEYPYSPNNPLLLTSTITKKQYTSLGTGIIVALTNGQFLDVIAQEAGAASTALPGQIDTWVSSVDGLTINQPNAAIGTDAQSDADLKTSCKARVGFVPTASTIGAGGAPGAYDSVARSGPDGEGGVVRPDGSRITVTRERDLPDGSGGVIVYVADADGALALADLALVEAAILAYAKPVGVPVSVQNAVALNITCTLAVWVGVSTSATDDEIKTAIISALVTYAQNVKIGGYDLGSGGVVPLRGGLEEAAAGEAPTTDSAGSGAKSVAKLLKLAFSLPSGDTSVAANAVPVIFGTPTITINRVSGA
jgi:hypothetical protein